MGKKYVDKNVYEAAIERIEFLFKEFDHILISFSGGKDSGVCLNLCYDYAKQHNMLDKLAMYHLDYEAQYQMTTDYVTDAFCSDFPKIKKYWLCLPISAQCACRIDGAYWIPWNQDAKDIWVRDMPDNEFVINECNVPFAFNKEDLDYSVQDSFVKWFGETYGSTAVVIGIRADESYNRLRAVITSSNRNQYAGKNYIYKRSDYHYNAYPIYDWRTEDIWIYNGRFEKTYNRLYDLYYQAGLSIDQMRVASPFNDYAMSSLHLYKAIDPQNWGKMVGRVNGVNMAGIYGSTTAMGWKKVTKPAHLTWKEYMYFLLDTLPPQVKAHYMGKLEASKKSWRVGGAMDPETIEELKAEGAPAIFTGKANNRGSKTKEVVQFDDYLDDTTVTDFKRIPTYKRMCICIMKNDWHCKYMGFAPTKLEAEKRKDAMEKWKSIL
jgi:predicted phosphoadenosine phosphosulfate sulfurtransferase